MLQLLADEAALGDEDLEADGNNGAEEAAYHVILTISVGLGLSSSKCFAGNQRIGPESLMRQLLCRRRAQL